MCIGGLPQQRRANPTPGNACCGHTEAKQPHQTSIRCAEGRMVPDMAATEELEGAWEPADPAAFTEVLGDIPHAVFGGGRFECNILMCDI